MFLANEQPKMQVTLSLSLSLSILTLCNSDFIYFYLSYTFLSLSVSFSLSLSFSSYLLFSLSPLSLFIPLSLSLSLFRSILSLCLFYLFLSILSRFNLGILHSWPWPCTAVGLLPGLPHRGARRKQNCHHLRWLQVHHQGGALRSW